MVALFGMGQYGDAEYLLNTMQKWRKKPEEKKGGLAGATDTSNKDQMEGQMWKAKIGQKLSALPEDDKARQVTVKEFPTIVLPAEKEIKGLLQKQLDAGGTFVFETGDTQMQDVAPAKTTSAPEAAALPTGNAPAATTLSAVKGASITSDPAKFRQDFLQSPQNVTITIYAKGVAKDKTEVNIQEDSVSVSFPHPQNPESSCTYDFDPLFAFIDPAESKISVMSTKIELSLRKRIAGQKWPSIEGAAPLKAISNEIKDTTAREAIMTSLNATNGTKMATGPLYPTSSKSGPKNWDKLANDLTAKKPKSKNKGKGRKKEGEDSAEEGEVGDDYDSDYGGDAVDGFFKQLYKGADDDTKRAMMKSFQESNGTSLSTSWSEVGKGPVQPYVSKD